MLKYGKFSIWTSLQIGFRSGYVAAASVSYPQLQICIDNRISMINRVRCHVSNLFKENFMGNFQVWRSVWYAFHQSLSPIVRQIHVTQLGELQSRRYQKPAFQIQTPMLWRANHHV